MALIDWAIAAIVVLSVLGAASSGFFIEAFSLVGLILGLLIASWNYGKLMPYLVHLVHSRELAEAIAFLAIAIGIMIAASLIGRLLRWAFHSVGLGWLDRLAGAAFGFLKGCVIVTLAVMAIAAFFPRNGWLTDSRFAPYFLSAAHTTASITPAEFSLRIGRGVAIIRHAEPDWLKPPT